MFRNKTIRIFFLLSTTVLLSACNTSPEHPGYTFMPDMQYSRAYETYDGNPLFKDSAGSLLPVEGTIPRGFMPFHFQGPELNYPEEYLRSTSLVNPVEATPSALANGKYNFEIYCAICHGDKGEGDGHLINVSDFPRPPSYKDEIPMNLAPGQMFYSIHFGKNMMGSYASQLSQKERWEVVHYIMSLQGRNFNDESVPVEEENN